MGAGPIALQNEAVKLSLYGKRVEEWRQQIEGIANGKVQCADCLAWIKRDENHTCKQQVRRNRAALGESK